MPITMPHTHIAPLYDLTLDIDEANTTDSTLSVDIGLARSYRFQATSPVFSVLATRRIGERPLEVRHQRVTLPQKGKAHLTFKFPSQTGEYRFCYAVIADALEEVSETGAGAEVNNVAEYCNNRIE